jgi:hypothetical protein
MPKKYNPIKNLGSFAHSKGAIRSAGMAKVVKTSKNKIEKVSKQMKGY